ncbi:MAG TPA: hypothetical protein VFX61_10215 [Micromonosporaceae bacterium]|nr:hypothetical protein [Micromonosporaceae bacterium]
MKYRMMRMPVWLLGILTVAFSACFSPIWLSTVMGLVEWNDAVVGGLFCGSAMALLLPLIRKRFEPPLEPPLTIDERIAAARAIDHGRPSDDPRVQAAAIFFAKQTVKTRTTNLAFPWVMVPGVLQLVGAAIKNPWLWFMFAAFVVGILMITVGIRRSNKRALELLAAADSSVQPVIKRQVRS